MQFMLEIGYFPERDHNIGFSALPIAHRGCGQLKRVGARLGSQWQFICEGCNCQIAIDEEEARKIHFAAIRRSEQQIIVCCSIDVVRQRIKASVLP